MLKNRDRNTHRILLIWIRHILVSILDLFSSLLLLGNHINSLPVSFVRVHPGGLGKQFGSGWLIMMFRREFCKSFGALSSLTKASSTTICKPQATKTCKMSLVTIPGMDVHSVMNLRGQIQVMWCPRWRILLCFMLIYKLTLCILNLSCRSSSDQCFREKRT